MSSRPSHSLCLLLAMLSGVLTAQEKPAAPVPAVPPPAPVSAGSAVPSAPVAPPLPGQLTAEPAAPASRIPDMPARPTAVPPTPLSSNKGIHSTSSTGQFIVHGNDLPLRSAFSSRCEEIHDELRKLLRDQQPWVLPVVVLLNSGESARKADKTVSMTLSEITHGGFHIQVTVNLRPDLRPTDFRTELVRALLAERVLRHQKRDVKRESVLPDWVFTGVMEALDYRKQARPSALFAAIFKSGKIFGIEEIIEASPTQMDALSKTIYRTSCCALVLALLDQPEGSARLNRFLSSLAGDARPERELLDQAFPSFTTSPASLNKWWALQLANLSRPGLSEPLTADATLSALEDALTLRYQSRASEVPQPRARPVLAKITPSEPATVSTVKPSGTGTPESAPLVSEAAPAEEKKGGFFRWLNPFSHRKSDDEVMIESAIEEAAKEEAKSRVEEEGSETGKPVEVAANITLPETEGPRAGPEEERKPVFNRWFGTGRKKPATEEATAPVEKPAVKQTGNAAEEKPAAEEKEEPNQKRSKLNPLNWFRGGKDKEPETDAAAPEEPAKKKAKDAESGETVSSLQDDWQWTKDRPLVAMVFQEVAVAEAEAGAEAPKQKKRLFGIFGGGKKPEEPKNEPAPEPKKEEAKPAAPKKETKEEPKEKPKAPEAKPAPEPAAEKKPEEKKAAEAPPPPAEMPAETVKFAEPPEAPAKPRRGLRGLFGGGDKKPVEEPKPAPAPAAPEPAKPEAMAAEAKPTPEKPVEKPKATAETPAPAKTEEPAKPAEMPVAESEGAKREPMRIRPLFGGKKKEEGLMPGEKAEEAPKAEPMTTEAKPEESKPSETKLKPKDVAKEASKPEKPTAEPASAPKVEEPKMPVAKPSEPKKPAAPAKKPEDSEPTVAAEVPIEDFAAIMKRTDRKQILQRNLVALTALQQRSAVLFRPIVVDYTALVSDLMDGKTRNMDERLHKLRERTQLALNQSQAIRDQLDLHEANSSPAMSGAFEDYLHLPETIQREMPPRQDAISKYLDSLDREFTKP